MKNFRQSIKAQQDQQKQAIDKNNLERLTSTNKALKLELQEKNNIISQLQSEVKESNIQTIEFSDIKINSNIRTNYADIKELTDNIKVNGLIQPLLLTNDNYLIDGHRRYKALFNLNIKEVKVNKIESNFSEIKDIFKELQYFSNEVRKNLDNFDLSAFYNSYSLSNKELSEKFNKSLGYISEIKAINKIDESLKKFLLEFQLYAYSRQKFDMSKNLESDKFYLRHKSQFIGIRLLYKIASANNQREVFYKLFKNRLSDKEKELFKGCEKPKKEKKKDSFKEFKASIKRRFKGEKLFEHIHSFSSYEKILNLHKY